MTRTAFQKFRKGERVVMTRKGKRLLEKKTTGVVHGYSRSPWSVLILRDGTVTPTSYHVDFWRKAK